MGKAARVIEPNAALGRQRLEALVWTQTRREDRGMAGGERAVRVGHGLKPISAFSGTELSHYLNQANAMVANRGNELWRKRQIILPEELDERLFEWHGGQSTATYALASTGMRNLVSLSMLDAAIDELIRVKAKTRGKGARELTHVLNGLGEVRQFWQEHSAKEAGMGLTEAEYEYDVADYGFTPEEEAALPTKSG